MLYRSIVRPWLFGKEAEDAHHFTFGLTRKLMALPLAAPLAEAYFLKKHPYLERELFGLRFRNPVGLAAGFDKNALLLDKLPSLGFGFVEIGTVTPRPQAGNPRPRLFRLLRDEAIINRMGFNNDGADVIAERLAKRDKSIIVGGNIGKNKDTPNERAAEDYLYCFHKLFDVVDYFTVNVSSPNTPGLRDLQERGPLTEILSILQAANGQKAKRKPILLKIAPDLSPTQLDDIIGIVRDTQLDGVIATNTTLSRDGLKTQKTEIEAIGAGGLSGKPLRQKATDVIRYLYERSDYTLPIIGAGGIHSPADALEKLEAGAKLIQLYTGFIYEGPSLPRHINRAILHGKVFGRLSS
jgi:dihydroorotate dehydrogenase